jgi:hypothetical protein
MREEDNSFRVIVRLYGGVDPPNDYSEVETQTEDCRHSLYASPWFPSISAAEKEMTTTARNYSDKNIKIMVVREIRKPDAQCRDSRLGASRVGRKKRERGH